MRCDAMRCEATDRNSSRVAGGAGDWREGVHAAQEAIYLPYVRLFDELNMAVKSAAKLAHFCDDVLKAASQPPHGTIGHGSKMKRITPGTTDCLLCCAA